MKKNSYMVVYFNGRGIREKFFDSRERALQFINSIDDTKATLWREENINDI